LLERKILPDCPELVAGTTLRILDLTCRPLQSQRPPSATKIGV
jgi:hypothetical protein